MVIESSESRRDVAGPPHDIRSLPGMMVRMLVLTAALSVYLWVLIALSGAPPVPGFEVGFIRLDLVAAAAVLVAGLWGLRVLSPKVGPRAYYHAVGSIGAVGLIVASATGAESGLVLALMRGVGLSLGVVVAGFVIARASTVGNAPE